MGKIGYESLGSTFTPPPSTTPNLHQCLQPKRQRLPWKWSLATSQVSFSGPSESGSLSPAFIKLSVGHPETVWEGNAKPPKCSSKINLMGVGGGFCQTTTCLGQTSWSVLQDLPLTVLSCLAGGPFPPCSGFAINLEASLGHSSSWERSNRSPPPPLHTEEMAARKAAGCVSATFTMCLYGSGACCSALKEMGNARPWLSEH